MARYHSTRIQRLFLSLFLGLTIWLYYGSPVYAEGSGGDLIFDMAGLSQPAAWDSWSQAQKHSYLQERNIYPAQGRKYQGSFDVTRYFESLEVTQPADWAKRTTAERQQFIASLASSVATVQPATFVPESELSAPQFPDEPSPTQPSVKEAAAASRDNVTPDSNAEAFDFSFLVLGISLLLLSLFAGTQTSITGRSPASLSKQILSLTCLYLLLLTFFASLFIISASNLKPFAITLGVWALNLFLILMFIKPVSVFLPRFTVLRRINGWRKELGVATFYLAFFHAIGLFMATNLLSQPETWLYGWTDPLFFGTVSLLLLLILFLTSNKFSMHLLKQNWKRVHYLAYPALLFALMHKFGLEHDSLLPALILFGVFVALKVSERKKTVPPLESH